MKADKTWVKYTLINGIVLGISLCIIEFTALFLGMWFRPAVFNIFVLLISLSVYIAIRKFRENYLSGLIKFGEAFITGLSICAFAGVIWAIYRFLQYTYMPGLIEEIVRIKTVSFEKTDISAEEKEMLLKLLKVLTTPLSLALLNTFFINMVIGGSFISLLMSYMLQRKELPKEIEF